MTNEATLTSLAMLKVSIDSGKDYLEYLRPYVLQVLSIDPPEIITDESVAKRLRETCGLAIPNRTIHVLLQRLAKARYLKREEGAFHIVAEIPTKGNFAAEKADAARHIAAVTQALIEFAAETSKHELDDESAGNALVAFLSRFSVPCLRAYLRGTALPIVGEDSDWQVTLVSQFVNDLPTNHPERFESFIKLVQGHMLANALLCPDLQSVTQSYKDVSFYLDTPLLIQFLGLEGTLEKQAIDELLELVQRLDGKFAYFSHTLEELVHSIRGSSSFVDSPTGRGTIVSEARKSGRSRSDLLLMADRAAELLAEGKMTMTSTPRYDRETFPFEISEEIFADVLAGEVNYYNPKAKEYDVKSVRSVYVLRRGQIPFSIEKCRAVLVTSNVDFSKAAYEYGKRYEESREVSTVITDFSLANTAWLKAPQGAPSLPRKEVLAFAYASIRPSSAFWDKVLEEADKLEASGRISERDHQLLRSSYHVQAELMRLTLGQDEALSEASITETLHRVSSEIRKEESEKLQHAERARAEAEQMLGQELARTDTAKQRIYWRSDRRANNEAWALSILIWAAQAVVAIFGVIKLKETSSLGWVMVATAVFSGLIRLAGTVFELKPLKIRKGYKDWRRDRMLKREYQMLGLEG